MPTMRERYGQLFDVAAMPDLPGYYGTTGLFGQPTDIPDPRVSSRYGDYRTPTRSHAGVDVVDPRGPAYTTDANATAPTGGTVVRAGWISGYGNAVEIDHGNGVTTLHGHLDSIGVKRGDKVKEGQVLGSLGKTGGGLVSGVHSHFETRVNGERVDPFSAGFSAPPGRRSPLSAPNASMTTYASGNYGAIPGTTIAQPDPTIDGMPVTTRENPTPPARPMTGILAGNEPAPQTTPAIAEPQVPSPAENAITSGVLAAPQTARDAWRSRDGLADPAWSDTRLASPEQIAAAYDRQQAAVAPQPAPQAPVDRFAGIGEALTDAASQNRSRDYAPMQRDAASSWASASPAAPTAPAAPDYSTFSAEIASRGLFGVPDTYTKMGADAVINGDSVPTVTVSTPPTGSMWAGAPNDPTRTDRWSTQNIPTDQIDTMPQGTVIGAVDPVTGAPLSGQTQTAAATTTTPSAPPVPTPKPSMFTEAAPAPSPQTVAPPDQPNVVAPGVTIGAPITEDTPPPVEVLPASPPPVQQAPAPAPAPPPAAAPATTPQRRTPVQAPQPAPQAPQPPAVQGPLAPTQSTNVPTVTGLAPRYAQQIANMGIQAPDGAQLGYSPKGGVAAVYGNAPEHVQIAATGPGLFGALERDFGIGNGMEARAANMAGKQVGKVAGGLAGGMLGGMVAGPPGGLAGGLLGSFLGGRLMNAGINQIANNSLGRSDGLSQQSRDRLNEMTAQGYGGLW